jgi:hypothetical protein
MLNLFRPGHQFAPTFGLRIVRILDLQPRIAVILIDAHFPLGDNAFQIVSAKRGYSLPDIGASFPSVRSSGIGRML